jgi:hypothetical protein
LSPKAPQTSLATTETSQFTNSPAESTSGQTKVTDPNGNFTTGDTTDGITTYQFDNRDRITIVIDALGHTLDKTYTSIDNVATVSDALQ